MVAKAEELTETTFSNYGVNKLKNNSINVVPLEENVRKMRIEMRKNQYLTRPDREIGLISLAGDKIDADLLNIAKIAKEQRQANIICGVMRHGPHGVHKHLLAQ